MVTRPRREPRSYVQRRLRAEWRRWVTTQRWRVAGLCAFFLVIGVPSQLFGSMWARGFSAGFLLCAIVSIMLYVFVMTTGSWTLIGGAWGEEFTRDELARAKRAGTVSGGVHNIELDGGDIDHLVIAPAEVIVIETKYRFLGLRDEDLADYVRAADRAARKTGSVLLSLGYRLPVTRAVVVWGRGRHRLPPDGLMLDDVVVVNGDHLAAWLAGRPRAPLAEPAAADLLRDVQDFKARLTVRPIQLPA